MQLDTSNKKNGHGLLNAVESILSTVFVPSLRKLEKGWGALDNPPGSQTKMDFLNNLNSFISVLTGQYTSRKRNRVT